MRPLVPLAMALALATLALPTAAARAQAALALEGPAEAEPDRVPFQVTLQLSDFACRHDRWVIVHLAVNGTAPGLALAADKVAFLVREGSYLSEPYRATAETWLRASGAGTATVTARLGDDLDDCFTAGDLRPATASWSVALGGGASSPAPAANETAAPDEAAPANETSATTPRASTLPPGAGYIGDFEPPAESAENEAPGVGLAALVAVGASCAILMRRSR